MSSDAIDQSPNQDVSSLLSTLLSSPESLSKIGDIIAKHTKEENRDFSPLNQQNPQTTSNISNNFDEISHKSEDTSTTSQNEIKEHTPENPLDFLSFLSLKINTLQITKCDVLIHDQPFHLAKHW